MGYVMNPHDIWICHKDGNDLGLTAEQCERIDKALAEFWLCQELMTAASESVLAKVRADMKRRQIRDSRRRKKNA